MLDLYSKRQRQNTCKYYQRKFKTWRLKSRISIAVASKVSLVVVIFILCIVAFRSFSTSRSPIGTIEKDQSFDEMIKAWNIAELERINDDEWIKNWMPQISDKAKLANLPLSVTGLPEQLAHLKFYEINPSVKYFVENLKNEHEDSVYGIGELSLNETHQTLMKLMTDFATFMEEQNVNYGTNGYWLDYGTLLGSWRNQSIISHDDDADMGIFDFVLNQLPSKWENDEVIWIKNALPSNTFVWDWWNHIRARFVSKKNGRFIDFVAYSVIEDQFGIKYAVSTAPKPNFKCFQILADILPINRNGILSNGLFNVPNNAENYLLKIFTTLKPSFGKQHRCA